MNDLINDFVTQARQWGFICEADPQQGWQIFSTRDRTTWQLDQDRQKWILSIRGVPQISQNRDSAGLIYHQWVVLS
jgi:hypothetical protein